MIDQSDIQARLRLFRYGVLVIIVLTFFVTLLAPFAWVNSYFAPTDNVNPQIGDFLGQAVIATIIAAVISIVAYVAYHYLLTKTWPLVGGSADTEQASAET